MTSNLQGPTLSDAKGERRIRKLYERAGHIDAQVEELQDKKGIIEHEISELEYDPARLRALVDRPALGNLIREGWT